MLLPTGLEADWQRCAIVLVEPALSQSGPVLTTTPWLYRQQPGYGGIGGSAVLLEAART